MGRALGIVLLVAAFVVLYAYDVLTILRSRLLTAVALSVLAVFLIILARRRVKQGRARGEGLDVKSKGGGSEC